ncbi:MAG: cation diffusion facilitator family transporter [Gammaproteobacteria bacterium]|nr:cation diffusion facilitator family transporter [Gammaproteobacteria bacterium]
MKLERWGWYSVLVNVLLASLHGLIAWMSGSLAVFAELVHNLIDLLGAVAVLVGIRLAARTSRAFPYGLYKIESLVAVGLAGLVLLTAYEVARDALFAPPGDLNAEPWMFGLLVLTTAVPLIFSHFEMRVGLAGHSPALVADAREYRVHAFTTGLAIVGLASQWLGMPLDRLAAGLIVVAVLKTAWDLLADAMRVLLDASLEAETLSAIRAVIEADPMVTQLNWVTGRNAGRYRFVEAGLSLRATSRKKVEVALRRIENAVRKAVPRIERLVVQLEPAASADACYALPLAEVDGPISEHFGEAPYFVILTLRGDDQSLVERRVVSNPYRTLERGKGIRVAEWLIGQKVDVVLSREVLHGRGPAYVFRDAGVELKVTEAQEVDVAISQSTINSVSD